jgi:hypothetical protein
MLYSGAKGTMTPNNRLPPDADRTGVHRCSGLHLKRAELAFSAVSRSDYLQLTGGSGSHYLRASLHSATRARIASGPAHAFCK